MTNARLRFIAFGTRVWYGITQAFTGIRGGAPVQVASSIAEILIRVAYGQKYRYDRPAGAMVHPRVVQKRLNDGSVKIGDCEDHAGYWIASLLLSDLADRCYLGSIYYENKGEKEGHAVCVFEKNGEWFWVDYNSPSILTTRDSWVSSVLAIYGDKLRGAILFDATLSEHQKVRFGAAQTYPG